MVPIAFAMCLMLTVGVASGGVLCSSSKGPTYEDCGAIKQANPDAKCGIYSITVPGQSSPIQVYCDMVTSGGGWTIFQRRKDGSEKFDRTWADYANGFGKLDGEFWLGNEYLAALTGTKPYRLRVDLQHPSGAQVWAEYNDFKISGAATKYTLSFADCSYFGNAGNGLTGAVHVPASPTHNGMKFSTPDQDNDSYGAGNCAKDFNSGWWFNICHSVNLNGQYNNTVSTHGINWMSYDITMTVSEMKIRSINY